MASTDASPAPSSAPHVARRALANPWSYVGVGAVILWLDLFTGPFLMFPILFVVPVVLCAWLSSAKVAYSLAVLLPLGRTAIALTIEHSHPTMFIVANALIRIVVLVLLAFLVARTARQTRRQEERVAGLVRMCAWSRTVEFNGEWLSFEDYLKKRFNLDTTHGISPGEVQRALDDIKN